MRPARQRLRSRGLLPALGLRSGTRRGGTCARRPARLPVPRLRVRGGRPMRRHALRPGAGEYGSASVRDPPGRRLDLRLVGDRRSPSSMAPAHRAAGPDRLERSPHLDPPVCGAPPGDDRERGGPGPPALRARLRRRRTSRDDRVRRASFREQLRLRQHPQDRRRSVHQAPLDRPHRHLRTRLLVRGHPRAHDRLGYAALGACDSRGRHAHRPVDRLAGA